jgi:hypothetical protein
MASFQQHAKESIKDADNGEMRRRKSSRSLAKDHSKCAIFERTTSPATFEQCHCPPNR